MLDWCPEFFFLFSADKTGGWKRNRMGDNSWPGSGLGQNEVVGRGEGLLAGQNVWSRGAQLGTEADGRKDNVRGFGWNSGIRQQGSRSLALRKDVEMQIVQIIHEPQRLSGPPRVKRETCGHARTHAESNRDIPSW